MDRTQQAVDVFNRHAQVYQHKYMDVSLYSESLDAFCALMAPGAAILEVACGPGNITQYLLRQRPDLRILATDLAPKMLELAKANNPGANIMEMDGKAIGSLERQFNGVVCGFLLPYLSKEEAGDFISAAAGRLLPGGALYLSTMEDDYNKSGIYKSSSGDEVYIYYHEERQLVRMLEACGLHIRHLQRKNYRDSNDVAVTDLVIVAVRDGAPQNSR